MSSIFSRISQITNCPPESAQGDACLANLPSVAADSSAVQSALTFVFSLAAAIAVLVIVIQGVKFVLSQGDPEKAANARKSIIYAVVGLVVAMSANIVVIFFLSEAFK